MSETNTTTLCDTCRAYCCKHFAVWLKPGGKMMGLIKAHYGREDLDRIKVHVYHRCSHLTDEGRCDIHGTDAQPEFCREFVCGWAKNDIMEVNVLDIHGEGIEQPMRAFLDNEV